jgi:asparagine synthase (glutamine-hydrolysing)
MCGICGFIAGNKRETTDWKQMLNRMTRVLIHRGPDVDGHYCTETGSSIVGLGHRRLSIIDLSEKASQPMSNEDDSVVVVFNGEIYNYKELTGQLKKKGHIFKSQSDTETIIHLYEDLGDQCVNSLDGMFAFALWDKKRERLLLARDRMGIKPLFYLLKEGNFYFASEIKALLLLEGVSREIDFRAVDYYITYGYIPGFRTIFKDIKKLPPASCLSFKNRQMKIKPYWSIQYLEKNNSSENELMDGLFNTFETAIERHLVSDVPVGAFLSGGLDSSIVVALMNRVGGKKIDTFSLGYESGGKDELDYAALVADYYRTNHHEFRLDPEVTQILPELLWHLDEPFFDNSIIPTYYISKLAKKNIKVVLSGDGGDEIFGGYEWTRRQQYHIAYKALPVFIRKTLGKLASGTGPEDDYGTHLTTRARRFLGDLNKDVEAGFLRRTSVSYAFRRMLYSHRFKEELGDFDGSEYQSMLFSEAGVMDDREKMLYVDTMSFLPDDCLFKVDRMSMAHGLEVRVPFLDRELVEFAARIPFDYKIRGLTSKYILKKTFSKYLPKKILKQRKQGFTIPISAWLRGGLGDLAGSILLSDSLEKRGLFRRDVLKWMLKEHRNGTQEFGHRIWSIVVFETWARLFLDMKIDDKPDMTLSNIASSS